MRTTALWLALAAAARALAQPAEARLSLQQLVQEAQRSNPEIQAAKARFQSSSQRPLQERVLPDPMVSLVWNSVGNPLPGAGLGREPVANIGLMASQEVPLAGKRRLRTQIAQKEADAESQEYRAAALAVLSRLKQAYYRLQHTYLMQEVLERNRDLLRSLARTTEARYASSRAAQAEVLRAQTQLTLVETRLVQLQREQRARAAEINGLLNRPQSAELGRPPAPAVEPLAFTAQELAEQARNAAPQLKRDQRMIERAASAVNLAGKNYYPDVTFNGGFFTMGTMGQMYMFRADVTLPVRRSRTRAEIAERSYELAGARYAYEATARSLESRIQEEYLSAQTAERLARLYRDTAIPQARLTAESSLAAYEAGSIDFAAVLSNYVAALEYEMNYHEQSQEFHLTLARLEEITGVELIP